MPRGRQMQMIAALDVERDGIAERAKHEIGPRPHRHHDLARGRRALRRRRSASGRRSLFEGLGIADQKAAALAAEQRGIGLCQPAGIGNESGRREDGPRRRTRRSDAARARRSPCGSRTSPATPYCLARSKSRTRVGQRRIGAKQLDPAGPPQQFRHAGFRNQRLMLDQAAPDQRHFGHRAVQRPLRRGGQIVAHQPRQECRQVGQAVAHLRRAVQRVSQDLPEIPRETYRETPRRIR